MLKQYHIKYSLFNESSFISCSKFMELISSYYLLNKALEFSKGIANLNKLCRNVKGSALDK